MIDLIEQLGTSNTIKREDAEKLNSILWQAMHNLVNHRRTDAKNALMEFSKLLSEKKGTLYVIEIHTDWRRYLDKIAAIIRSGLQ